MTSALAAFNGSGTQGTAAICKMHTPDDGDVQSAFWNRNDTTRFLLFGSSIQEIPTSGGQSVGINGNQIFTVNNDLDCLGDIYAQVSLKNTVTLATTSDAGDDYPPIANLTAWGLARFITRIEFMVGTQIWQTMEANDLLNVLNTELPESAYHNAAFQCNGNHLSSGPKAALDPNRGVYPLQTMAASIKLPLLNKTLQPMLSKFTEMTEDGYLMAAAPHQQVKIRLTYAASLTDVLIVSTATHPVYNPSSGWNSSTFQFAVKLYAKQQIMCNAERQQLKNMPLGLPKRIKMTQNAQAQVVMRASQTSSAIDLDHFSLFASYLVVSIDGLSNTFVGYDTANGVGGTSPDFTAPYTSVNPYDIPWTPQIVAPGDMGGRIAIGSVAEAELLLNSTSVSGVLPGEFLTSSAAESLGLYSNLFTQGLNLGDLASGFFVFPLASHAYDASAVPLNRFDNIRLRIKTTSDGKLSGNVCNVTVTCVGETTALYKGGAASLAMY
jgi:hypothetical protein